MIDVNIITINELTDFNIRPGSIHDEFLKAVVGPFQNLGNEIQLKNQLPDNPIAKFRGDIAQIALYSGVAQRAEDLLAAFQDVTSNAALKETIDDTIRLAFDGRSTVEVTSIFISDADYRNHVIQAADSYFKKQRDASPS